MPANKKYLSSPGQRVLKITAALIGGYLVTFTFHLFLLALVPAKPVVNSATFAPWLIWAVLMLLAFLAKNGWKIWGWYLLASVIFVSPYLYQQFASA